MTTEHPKRFTCPITLEIMKEPYIDRDGNSFEKDAIFSWVLQHGNSPITRNIMHIGDLSPNRALKESIEEYLEISTVSTVALQEAPLTRDPVSIIAILDVSGSMGENCDNVNSTEQTGLSRLDLVKHTISTIIGSLSSQDTIGILSFNNKAQIVNGFRPVTPDNKKFISEQVSALSAGGGTNIWDALRLSIELVKTKKKEETTHILLFTDGESNDDPPRGIVETLKGVLALNHDLDITINTYGFGNNINSKLLYEISEIKNGVFGFIPDSTMIGTVFINSLAYLLTRQTKVALNPEETAAIGDVVTGLNKKLKYGNTPDLAKLCGDIKNHGSSSFLMDLLLDCKPTSDEGIGQISKAMEDRYFKRWGQHYLFSVLSAYQNQLCLNFKDKGVQHFKTSSFEEQQSLIEAIFINLPPPVPTCVSYDAYGHATTGTQLNSQQFTQTFYNQSGGCFLEGTKIKIITEDEGVGFIPVQDVKRGTQVVTDKGITNVVCVIKMKYSGPIYRIDTTAVTAYHPVYFKDEEWIFPSNCSEFTWEEVQDAYVYDYILEDYHTVKLFDLFAVTLAHHKSGPVVGHDYFGTERIKHDLMDHPDWNKGYILLEDYKFVRDLATNKVIRLEY
jgi:uncharacterized protein YegL